MATIRAVPELCVCINTKLLSNKNNKSEICGGLVRNSSCVGVLNVYGKRRCSRRWRVKAVARSDVNGNVRVIEKSSGGNVKGNRSGLVDITVLCYQNRCNARRISINLSKWKYPQECSFATCPFGKSSSVTSSVFTSRVSLIYSHRGACFESTTKF